MKRIQSLSLLAVVVVAAFSAGAWVKWNPAAATGMAAPPPVQKAAPGPAAAAGAAEPAKDPVCGMEVEVEKARAAGRTVTHGSKTYFFCSEACKKKFQADPAHYAAAAPASAQSHAIDSHSHDTAPAPAAAMGAATPATDPVCGMEVDEAKARAAGRTTTRGGKTYFFCSDACRKKFEADPAH